MKTNKAKFKKIKDEPIGKLVRPIKLYKGYIYPTNTKENFSFWFSQTKKTECLFQTQKECLRSYKNFIGDYNKNILSQYKNLKLGNFRHNEKIVDGYCAVITGFIYYFNKNYHLCNNLKEQNSIIKKSKKNSNIKISFLVVKLYKKTDIENKKGLDEWEFHSSESFELIYPADQIISLDYIVELENLKPGYSVKNKRNEHIILETFVNEFAQNVVIHSLSKVVIRILTKRKIRNLNYYIDYVISY